MRGPNDFHMTDEEKERVAKVIASIEERAETGVGWPAIYGPVHLDQRVFDAVLRELRTAGWDAGYSHEGMLVIRGARI